jgi:hypothetical protein
MDLAQLVLLVHGVAWSVQHLYLTVLLVRVGIILLQGLLLVPRVLQALQVPMQGRPGTLHIINYVCMYLFLGIILPTEYYVYIISLLAIIDVVCICSNLYSHPLFIIQPSPFSCTLCEAGSFNPYNESTSCGYLFCPGGTFAPAGSSSCSMCPSGSVSPPFAANCTECAAGSYAPIGSSVCSLCPVGTASAVAGQTECTACSAGYISGAGATNCSQCSIGSYALSTVACALCPSGSYSTTLGSSTCQSCDVGTFSGM